MDAAALERRTRAKRAFRVNIAAGIAVVSGVGVDQNTLRASFLGVANLQAAENLAVANQDDLILDVDAEFFERAVVFQSAVIGVDHLAFDASRHAVTVKRREGGGAGRILVGGIGVFGQ